MESIDKLLDQIAENKNEKEFSEIFLSIKKSIQRSKDNKEILETTLNKIESSLLIITTFIFEKKGNDSKVIGLIDKKLNKLKEKQLKNTEINIDFNDIFSKLKSKKTTYELYQGYKYLLKSVECQKTELRIKNEDINAILLNIESKNLKQNPSLIEYIKNEMKKITESEELIYIRESFQKFDNDFIKKLQNSKESNLLKNILVVLPFIYNQEIVFMTCFSKLNNTFYNYYNNNYNEFSFQLLDTLYSDDFYSKFLLHKEIFDSTKNTVSTVFRFEIMDEFEGDFIKNQNNYKFAKITGNHNQIFENNIIIVNSRFREEMNFLLRNVKCIVLEIGHEIKNNNFYRNCEQIYNNSTIIIHENMEFQIVKEKI